MKPLKMLAACCFLILLAAACTDQDDWQSRNVSGLLPGLELGLQNPEGETVQAQDLAGQVVLLFFGFTHCPDICPATLARLQAAVASLPAEQQARTAIVFVTVDPGRDDAERLAAYARAFGDRVVALRTDDIEKLDELTRRYRVTYGYGEPNAKGQYEVSHSSGVFIFDPEGQARLLVRATDPTGALATDLRHLWAEF